jgi:NADPH:quinone reductase
MPGHDNRMHAIEVSETGGPKVLRYVDTPQPAPGPGEMLIKAEAIGVNFIDTYFRSGQYPRELPFIRTGDEFSWRANELFEAVANGAITIEVGGRYPLSEAARVHEDLQGRKTAGSIALLPWHRMPIRHQRVLSM